MQRLLPARYSPDAPAMASTLLLRWLTFCVAVCLAGAAGFYLLASFNSDTSMHRREMNAAAYRAQLYFDQREALLNYLVDSVVTAGQTVRAGSLEDALDDEDVLRLDLGTDKDGRKLRLLLSERATRTLAGYGAGLVHVSADPQVPTRWLHRNGKAVGPPPSELTPELLQRHAAHSTATSQVFWLASSAAPSRVYLYRAAEDEDSPSHWLVLALDGATVADVVNSKGVGDFVLLDDDGAHAIGNRSRSQLPASWLDAHREDTFASVWSNGIPQGLALVKGIGDDGWRLVYHVPMRVLMNDNAANILIAILLCVAAMAALIVLTHRINLQLIQPALQQHQLLMDSFNFGSTVLDMAPVGICVLRCADGHVMLENQRARDWLGSDTTAGDWVGSWRRSAGTVNATGAVRRGGDFTSATGRQLQLLHAGARYLDEDVLLCVFSDISQHRQIQAALSAAKQAADEASQAKSNFVATMSHEIRTPLYGMLGTLDLLGQTALDARQARYYRTIQQSSSVLLKLISDILDVSKIEAGRLNLSTAAFSPQVLAESVVLGYSAAAMAKHLQILVSTDPDLPRAVIGDADRIRQVLGNLLSNAIKFTDSGRVLLRVRCETVDGGMASLSWQVTDTGIGIDPADQALLFEPFHQAAGGAQAQGTGLGLSISDHLVKLMDGTLRVTSEKGLGSSFTMTLPLTVDLADQDPDEIVLSPCPPVYVRSPLPELAENACRWLRRWGATAHCHVEGQRHMAPGSILVDTDASQGLVQDWPGPRVVASGDAGEIHPDQTSDKDVLSVSMYSIEAVGQAVALLQQGLSAPTRLPGRVRGPTFDLDILVAEDNPINRVILKEQLEALGCRVTTANDGLEALALATRTAFDVLVTDINMPGMDGHALVANLRQRPTPLYVIGATANATREERDRCLRGGMQDYLVKPVTTAALRDALSPLLARKRAC